MQPGNKPEPPDSPRLVSCLGGLHAAVAGLWHGTSGRIVRCVPTRWTVAQETDDGWLFAKFRRGERARAAAEWRWLHVLPLLGLRTPMPVAWIGRGARTMLVTRGVAGRPLDAWIADAAREGWLPQLCAWACREVAPRVRILHGAGLAYRDLYWNHVVAPDPRGDALPTFLDVERVFRPVWRRRRWQVKDLAGLLSSLPATVSASAKLRFVRAYDPVAARDRRWLRAIARKGARIRGHAPRYG